MSSAGQALGGIIGAVAGFFLGGGPAGALRGFSIGASIGGMLDPPKGPNQTGPRLTDLSTQTSTYGTAIPRVYGTIATLGNIFWLQDDKLTEVVTVSKQKSGKGGGGKSTTTTYSYNATFAVGLCQGEIEGVRRIWVGANLIYDAGSDNFESIIASNEAASGFKIYTGSETQTADPRMQADKGVANVPAYRGLAYIVFYDFALKDYGNSLLGAQVKVEVLSSLSDVSHQTTAVTLPNNKNKCVAWDGSRYIALHEEDSLAAYSVSYNGSVWTRFSAFPGTYYNSRCVVASDGRGTTYAVWGRGDGLWKTSDGYRWAKSTLLSSPTTTYFALASNGTSFLAISTVTLKAAFFLESTESGDEWVRTEPPDLPPTWAFQEQIASNSEYYVALLGIYSPLVWVFQISTKSWATYPGPFATGFISMAWAESLGVWYGVTQYNQCAMTSDFIEWAIVPPGTPSVGEVFYGNGTLYKTSDQKQYWSTDGEVWGVILVTPEIACRDFCWNAGVGLFLGYGTTSQLMIERVVEGEKVPLAEVISAECLSSGLLKDDDIDVTAVDSDVRGYRVSETGAIRAALEPLQGAMPFDVIPKGYKIAFVPRGGSSVKTIADSMLDARAAGTAPGVALTTSREMDSQLPRRVSIKYFDNTREYDISEQYAERLNTDAVNVLDSTLPIVLNATEAAGVAEKLLYLYWLERYNLNFTLPPEYLDLEPGDVITLTGDFGSYEIRLTEINYTSGGWLECRGRFNNSAIYTPAASGEEGSSTGKAIAYGGASYYALLDIPCLQDVFNAPGFPAAMCGFSTTWPGGTIFKSNDDGQTWTDVQGFTGAVPVGIALSVLATGRTDIIDTANTLSVSLLAGELVSVTQAQLLNGANYFAIGAHGRWEIAAAQTCALQVDGSYILSDFLRGRFGTEWAMTTHAVGDAVVLLTDADMAWVGIDTASIGLARQYRGITTGAAIDSDASLNFTYSGVNLECLSPVYLNGSRHPATNDWTLTWIRRSRIDGALRNYVDVSLGETAESYEIDIYADGTYATVKRTITATSQTCSYTSAQQTTDFGGNQTTLYVKVYQLSATVGRGYPLTATITR